MAHFKIAVHRFTNGSRGEVCVGVQVTSLLFIASQVPEKVRRLRKKECFPRGGKLSRALLKMATDKKAQLVAS